MSDNGRNKWIMYLVGVLVTIIVFIAIPTMAKQIWENDRRSTDARNQLYSEMMAGDARTLDKVDKIADIVTDIRIQQMESMTILKRLDK